MIALVDGDVLCHQACEKRFSNTNRIDIISLDDTGKKILPTFTAEEDKNYLKKSWKKFNIDLEKLLGKLYTNDYFMAVKGQGNFRDDLYPLYKKNRVPGERYQAVNSLRQLATFEGIAVPAHGREADDLLRVWSEECRSKNKDYIVVSIDKDLRCIPGKHWLLHLNLKDSERLIEISEVEAKRHYYGQILKGDPTDNIPGIPGVGPVTADRLVAELSDDNDFQEVVVSQYLEFYGDDWFPYFLLNAKMIHLQKHVDDYFDPYEWPIIKELMV